MYNIDQIRTDIANAKKEGQIHLIVGNKVYTKPTREPLQITFSEKEQVEVSDLAYYICELLKDEKRLNMILSGLISFRLSKGRNVHTGQCVFIKGFDKITQAYFNSQISYLIEVTSEFYDLSEDLRVKELLFALRRIPPTMNPNGRMISPDSFDGLDYDITKLKKAEKLFS